MKQRVQYHNSKLILIQLITFPSLLAYIQFFDAFNFLQVNTKSLEDAVTLYLNLAEVKTKEAREKSAETALKMVEDLDMIESPEG